MKITKKTKITSLAVLGIIFTCFAHTSITQTNHISIFDTIEKITKYANTHEEYPEIDNNDWLHPDYRSFYTKNMPTKFENLLYFLHIKHKPLWNAHDFKQLLEQVTTHREELGYMGRFIQQTTPVEGSKFILWSSLFGAFHSLSRCLNYLQKKGIINNQLQITNKNHFFVFNGNSIDISSYNLETLTVILQLMEKNPNNILYIRGKHEDTEYWLNFGLRNELEIRTMRKSPEEVPLRNLINRFFNTLPLALYLTQKNSSGAIDTVRISYYDRNYKELDETKYTQFFDLTNKEPGTMYLAKINDQKQNPNIIVNIKAILKSSETLIRFFPRKGMAQVDPDKGSTAFVTFSSPIKSHRVIHRFFYDAFTVIDIKPKFENWTLTLFNQDVREKLGIQKIASFNLSSGDLIKGTKPEITKLQAKIKRLEQTLRKQQKKTPQPTVAPSTISKTAKNHISKDQKESIKLGTTLDTNNELADLGIQTKAILTRIIEEVNDKGGIHGQLIQLTILEDGYQPSRAKQNIQTLQTKYKTNTLISPTGSATTEQYFKEIKDGTLTLLFPQTSYYLFRNPELKHIINFGPSSAQVEQFTFDYIQKQIQPKTVAFFYQKKLAGSAIPDITKTLNPQNYVIISYDPATLRLKDKAKKILAKKPDVLFIFSTPASATKLIEEIGPVNLRETIIVGHRLGSKKFKAFLAENNILNKYIGIENVENPQNSKVKILQQYTVNTDKKNQDSLGAQTYIGTKLLIQVLKEITPPITNKKIIDKLESLKNYNFDGFIFDFDAKTRTLSNQIWVEREGKAPQRFVLKKDSSGPTKTKKTTIPEKIAPTKTESASTNKELVIGTTLDLEGRRKQESIKIKNAILASFKKVNEQGGIAGKKIRLIALNDAYDPQKARNNVLELLQKHSTDILLSTLGGPTAESFLDLVKQGKVLTLFPNTSSSTIRNPQLSYAINFGPSYEKIDTLAIKYLMQKKQSRKFAFFFEDNQYTEKAVMAAIANNKLPKDTYIIMSYKRGTTIFTEQAEQIKNFKPDTIALWGLEFAAQKLLKAIGLHNLTNTKFTSAQLTDKKFISFLRENGLFQKLINISYVPNPNTKNIPLIQECAQVTGKQDIITLETYIGTQIFLHALKNISPPITKEKIIKTIEGMQHTTLQGFPIHFDPNTRQISNTLWIQDGDNPEWIQVKDNSPAAPAS